MASFCRFLEIFKAACLAMATCVVALVGALVGMIVGALAGQTKEIGFFRGAGVGAIAGALLSIDVLESVVHGQTLYLEAILISVANGKVFHDCIIPAALATYQQQAEGVDTSYEVAFDIFSAGGTKGLLLDSIKKLQVFDISYQQKHEACAYQTSCAICLQDFNEGDAARRLPQCRHIFHVVCVDGWLTRHACCPLCRNEILM